MVMAVAKGNVAVITGAASGNGLAAAQHLARLGLRVCLADLGAARLDAARSQMLATVSMGRVEAAMGHRF